MRADPVSEPALRSMYMIRGLRPLGFCEVVECADCWPSAITVARASFPLAGRFDIVVRSMRDGIHPPRNPQFTDGGQPLAPGLPHASAGPPQMATEWHKTIMADPMEWLV